MRTRSLLVVVALLLASCASSRTTIVKTSKQVEEDRRQEVEMLDQQRQRDEHLEHEDTVLQAFTLQDVAGCERLSQVRYVTLDKARSIAVDLSGNRILAQWNRSYAVDDSWTSRLARTVGTIPSSARDDYEVYRCDPPSDSAHKGGG